MLGALVFLYSISPVEAIVAERLRRLTRNQIPYGSAGSNPAGCVYFLHSFSVCIYHFSLGGVDIITEGLLAPGSSGQCQCWIMLSPQTLVTL